MTEHSGDAHRTAYQEFHDMRIEPMDDGVVVGHVPYDETLTNPFGVINGGVVATLIDVASGAALRRTFDDPDSGFLATVDLDVKYLNPATEDLRAEVTVAHAGGSVGVTEADVTAQNGDGEPTPVAIGTTAYRLFRGEPGGE